MYQKTKLVIASNNFTLNTNINILMTIHLIIEILLLCLSVRMLLFLCRSDYDVT